MPKVNPNETRNEYVSRAIPIIKKENPELSQKAVIGKAEGLYNSSKKKGK